MRIVYLGEAGAASALLAVLLRLSREHPGTALSHFLCCLAFVAASIIVLMVHSYNLLDPLPARQLVDQVSFQAELTDTGLDMLDELENNRQLFSPDEYRYWIATIRHTHARQQKHEGKVLYHDFRKSRSPRSDGNR